MPRIVKSLRRRRRRQCLPRDSLHSILQQHVGSNLFVPPKYWTDLHSRLLRARFCKLPPCDTPMPDIIPGLPPSDGQLSPSNDIKILLGALNNILNSKGGRIVSNAVKTVLSKLWPAAFCHSQRHTALHMFFDRCVYREEVCVQVIWNDPHASSNQLSLGTVTSTNNPPKHSPCNLGSRSTIHNSAGLPMMCYVRRADLDVMRKNAHVPRGAGGIRTNLQKLHSRRLQPAIPDHDSHLVAIFLAMAQRHFYHEDVEPSRTDSPPFHDMVLKILSHDSVTAQFIVYTGHISSIFLDMFHDPSKTPKSHSDKANTPSIDIEYTKVPIWPIIGLRERLGKALGEEIVGLFDSSTMATWVNDANDCLATDKKRKTEIMPAQLTARPNYSTYIGREEVMGGQRTINPPRGRPYLSSLCRNLQPYTVRAKELDTRRRLITVWRRPVGTFCLR